jgi:hypothetical protein
LEKVKDVGSIEARKIARRQTKGRWLSDATKGWLPNFN